MLDRPAIVEHDGAEALLNPVATIAAAGPLIHSNYSPDQELLFGQ